VDFSAAGLSHDCYADFLTEMFKPIIVVYPKIVRSIILHFKWACIITWGEMRDCFWLD